MDKLKPYDGSLTDAPAARPAAPLLPTIAKFSKSRLLMAFAVAGASDALSAGLTFIPPLEFALDLVTALLLFWILGWHWIMLPGLVMEAIPGLSVFPFWVLVVTAVAVWGTPRPRVG